MSISMMTAVWQLPNRGNEKLVMLALADRANDDGVCWPGQTSLAAKCSMSTRNLRRILENLEGQGLIEVTNRPGEGGGRLTNVYKLCISCVEAGQADNLSGRGNRTNLQGNRTTVSTNTSDKPSEYLRGETPKGVDKEAWENWHQYRMSKESLRKSWGPQAQKIAATRLRELSPEAQRRCVEDGIQSGWKGIYTEKYKRNGSAVPQSAPKRQSAIQTCNNANQLAALCQAAGIGLPPPGMDMHASKLWAMRKLGTAA